jgi:uncharacterized protein YuzE
MQMRYDAGVDALVIELTPDAASACTVQGAPGVSLDFDAEGRLVAVELLEASWHVPRNVLDELGSADGHALAGVATPAVRRSGGLRPTAKRKKRPQ